ncbi:MAG: TonB-dependent receptor [Vicinamibacteria bacterium]
MVLPCLVLLSATSAYPQRLTGSIRGVLKDTTGASLPGATLEVRSEALIGGPRATVSGDDGQYRFPALPPGDYQLTVSLAGFQTIQRSGLRVVVGSTVTEDVTLELAALEEVVTVLATNPVVDATRSSESTNYTQEFIENTPVTRYSFFDLVNAAPGAAQTSYNEPVRTAFFGSNTNENSYQLDGTDLTAPISGAAWPYPSPDVIEEMEILSLGAPAEYGNVQGAVINVITKSGGNELHGDFNAFFQTQGLTASNTEDQQDPLFREFPYHRAKYRDISAQLGGAVVKDKIWFYGGVQTYRDHSSQPGVDPQFPEREEADRIFGKVTWQINSKNKLTGQLHNDYYRIPGDVSFVRPPETTVEETGDNPTPNVTWTSVVNDETYFDVRYAGFYGNDHGEPVSGTTSVPGHYDVGTGYYSVNTPYWYDGEIWKSQFSGKVSHYADDFLGSGSHDFRFGVQFSTAGNDYRSGFPGGVAFYDYYGEPYLAYYQTPYHYGANVKSFGAFADDTWTIGERVSINVGVRYDRSTAENPDFPVLDNDGNETGATVTGLGHLFTWNVVSPRVGATFRLTEDGKTALRAHYGRYYQALITGPVGDLSPSISRISQRQWNPDTGEYEEFFVINPSEEFGIDPNVKDPYTDQFIIGMDREILPDLGVNATFVYKRSRDFLGQRNQGAVYEEIPFEDPLTGEIITVFNQVNDTNLFLLTNPPDFNQTYRGFAVTATKRFSQGWSLIGSFTVSKNEGLNSGSTESPSSDASSTDNFDFGRDPNDLINADGIVWSDRTYMFKVQAVYELPYDIALAANWQWFTGRPWVRQVQASLNQGIKEIFNEPNDGSRRVDDQNLVDLRVEKAFPVYGSLRASVLADVFNVFNSDAALDVASQVGTQDVFGVPSTFVGPRRLQFGFKLSF